CWRTRQGTLGTSITKACGFCVRRISGCRAIPSESEQLLALFVVGADFRLDLVEQGGDAAAVNIVGGQLAVGLQQFMRQVEGRHDGNAFQADHVGLFHFTHLVVEKTGGTQQRFLLFRCAADAVFLVQQVDDNGRGFAHGSCSSDLRREMMASTLVFATSFFFSNSARSSSRRPSRACRVSFSWRSRVLILISSSMRCSSCCSCCSVFMA